MELTEIQNETNLDINKKSSIDSSTDKDNNSDNNRINSFLEILSHTAQKN